MKTGSPKQKKLILRALTEPSFRKSLENPLEAAKVLGLKKISLINEKEIRFVLASVKGIEAQILALADELLCANNGNGTGSG